MKLAEQNVFKSLDLYSILCRTGQCQNSLQYVYVYFRGNLFSPNSLSLGNRQNELVYSKHISNQEVGLILLKFILAPIICFLFINL